MIKRRLELTRGEVLAYSNNVVEKIKKLDIYNVDMTVGLYMPINNEIEVRLDNKKVCYPKVVGNDLLFFIPNSFEKGCFDILEPVGIFIDKKDILHEVSIYLFYQAFLYRTKCRIRKTPVKTARSVGFYLFIFQEQKVLL